MISNSSGEAKFGYKTTILIIKIGEGNEKIIYVANNCITYVYYGM
jgi:ribosomal protein L30E